MQELSPAQAAALRDSRQALFLDVREDWEFALCHIVGALHVPMGEIPARLAELPREAPIVVVCHHGMRSRQVMHYLARQGYADVHNLDGGIDAWAASLDAAMARY